MEAIYQKALLELAQQARQSRQIDAPTHHASMNNPVCGDRVHLHLIIIDGKVVAQHAEVKGCALCEAGAGLWLELIQTHPPEVMSAHHDALKSWLEQKSEGLPFGGADPLTPIRPIKNRHQCVLLALKASTQITSVSD